MIRLIALFTLLASPLLAQDRQGNDTPGEWRVDHHKAFGLWDSMCDWRETDGLKETRCYLRYVDVFAPRPKFGAVFAFITPEVNGPRISFGFENGVQYQSDGFQIEGPNGPAWTLKDKTCIRLGECVFEGETADPFLAALSAGDGHVLRQRFIDPHSRQQDLTWDLSRFPDALADFQTQSEKRGL